MNKEETIEKIEEERRKRILEVGEFYRLTGMSTRKIAAHFTAKGFPMSNYTVCKYIHKYREFVPGFQNQIDRNIENNRAKSVETEAIRNRVLQATKLCLDGWSLEEIAEKFQTTVDVIHDDLCSRLGRIENVDAYFSLNEEEHIVDIIKNILSNNSRRNLIPGGKR